jgi:hypothetical protein
MKTCRSCKKGKPLSEFRRWSLSSDGRRHVCRACQCAAEKAWRDRTGKGKEYARRFRRENPAAYAITRCRQTALRKGLAFDLDRHVAEITARVANGRCEISGIAFTFDGSPRCPTSPSIDRRNCGRGYTLDNIQVVCLAVNAMLGTWGQAAAEPIVRAWAEKIA